MYYFLEKDYPQNAITVKCYEYNSSLSKTIDLGQSISDLLIDKINITVQKVKPKHIWVDYLGGNISLVVVSQKFRKIIEEIEQQEFLEFYPVNIMDEDGVKYDVSYFLLVITDNIHCLDKNRSSFSYYDDSEVVSDINELVLDESKIGDRQIFRFGEVRPEILISQKIKTAIEDSNLMGISFLPSDEFEM